MTTLKGGPELMALLDSLPEKLERKFLRGGLRAAAAVVAKDAQARTNSPEIREGIYLTSGTKNGAVYAKVKLKGFAASVGIWAEYGTAAHWITVDPRDRRAGKGTISIRTLNKNERQGHSLVIGGKFVGPSVHHPGAKPYPFLRPALDANEQAAVEAAANYIRSRIESQGLNAPEVTIDDGDDE